MEIPQSPDKLSKLAAGMFVRVSQRYPAEFGLQIGGIVELCRNSGINEPSILLNALLSDKDRIEKISKVANFYHRKMGVEIEVTSENITNIITDEFTRAQEIIDQETLKLNASKRTSFFSKIIEKVLFS